MTFLYFKCLVRILLVAGFTLSQTLKAINVNIKHNLCKLCFYTSMVLPLHLPCVFKVRCCNSPYLQIKGVLITGR